MGGDFEQDTARLAEIDGAEIETIDDGRGLPPTLDHTVTPRWVVLVAAGRPGDMMYSTRA